MATSGSYNNYWEGIDDSSFSHIIDPKDGWPLSLSNGIMSTTVIAPNCIDADALATMLMVMDKEKGIGIINNMEDVECMLIIHQGNNLTVEYSDGFEKFIEP